MNDRIKTTPAAERAYWAICDRARYCMTLTDLAEHGIVYADNNEQVQAAIRWLEN